MPVVIGNIAGPGGVKMEKAQVGSRTVNGVKEEIKEVVIAENPLDKLPRMKDPQLFVLYGSQTGNAQDVGERLTREALNFQLKPYLCAMDDAEDLGSLYTIYSQEDTIVCFVCSTTGQGNEPSNMKKFWRYLLKKSHGRDLFCGMRFGVIGLGDSSYAKYNFVAKKLFKRLVELGGTPIVDLGLADEQHELGIDSFIDPWITKFWQKANSHFERPHTFARNSVLPIPKYKLQQIECSQHNEIPKQHPVRLRSLLKKERMTAEDHFQETQLLSFEIGESVSYCPGDVLMVQPSNLDGSVEKFFELFPKLNAIRHEKYKIVPNPDMPWVKIPRQLETIRPQPWSLEDIVKNYFDLQTVPRRYFFELLAQFTSSDLEREGLLDISSPAGQEALFRYCTRPKRTILEVLEDFPHATSNVPTEYIFDLIPAIKPRAFSIASSMKRHPGVIQILMAVVNYSTSLKEPRKGLCSNWLNGLEIGELVPIWVETGSFFFPLESQPSRLILVGPGTGCAPFRSLISERYDDSFNYMLFFFGCRSSTKDFYFKDELEEIDDEFCQLTLYKAFSREEGMKKTYVQHKILDDAESLGHLIVKLGAYVYVAGNAKLMPIGVQEAVVECLVKAGIKDPGEYLKNMIKTGRYQTEVW